MNTFFTKIKSTLLFLGDIVLLYLVLSAVLILRYSGDFTGHIWNQHFWPFTIMFAAWLVVFYISGLYDNRNNKNDINFYSLVFKTILINAGVGVVYFYIFFGRLFTIRPMWVFVVYLIIFSFVFLLWRRLYNQLTLTDAFLQNVFFIGNGKELNEFIEELKRKPYLGYRVVDHLVVDKGESEPVKNLDLTQVLKDKNIDIVVTSLDMHRIPEIVSQFYKNLFLGIRYYDFPTFYERVTGKVPVTTIGQLWFLENLSERDKNVYESFKRITDVSASILIGLVAALLTPFIALAIKLDSKGPVLFLQKRVGKGGKPFLAMKFRSMVTGADHNGPQWTRKNDSRITRLGIFLRKTKLDEIPQLINVLKGEMSFIGPRPEQVEFVENLTKKVPYYNERHLVKPGLTGWAQVNLPLGGASEEDTLQKLQHDLYYIKHRSVFFDLGVLLKTINIILTGQGR